MNPPYYVINASVPPGNRITNFHGDPYSLFQVDRFRFGSFDVAVPMSPVPGPNGSFEAKWDDRKLLRLYQDGNLMFRTRADFEFLGWGMEAHAFGKFPKLDPLVAVEVNTSFVHQYLKVLNRLKNTVSRVSFHLSIHNGAQVGTRLFLTKHFASTRIDWNTATRYYLQTDPAEESLDVPAEDLRSAPNAVAWKVVEAFFSMFDVPPEDIPFAKQSGTMIEVDLDQIKAR